MEIHGVCFHIFCLKLSQKRFQCKYILFKNGQKRSRNDVKKEKKRGGRGQEEAKTGIGVRVE